MRVCDRHNRKPAVDEVRIQSDGSVHDLCADCSKQIIKFLGDRKRETVEKAKKKTIFG